MDCEVSSLSLHRLSVGLVKSQNLFIQDLLLLFDILNVKCCEIYFRYFQKLSFTQCVYLIITPLCT